MKQQTVVEFLLEKYKSQNNLLFPEDWEQAKQLEKEKIMNAFYQGVDQESDTHGAMNLDMKDAENYYNETFKTK